MKTRRGKVEIVIDILRVLQNSEATKTAIVYSANLNFSRADHYLDLMIESGLIQKSAERYSITERGNSYFKKMSEMNSLLDIPKI